jgi:hypothetical protein
MGDFLIDVVLSVGERTHAYGLYGGFRGCGGDGHLAVDCAARSAEQ